jgi:hypothetical protein
VTYPSGPQAYAPHGMPPRGYPPRGYPAGYGGYPPQGPGYGYSGGYPGGVPTPPVRQSSHTKVLGSLLVGLLIAVGAFVLVSKLATPAPNHTKVCNPTCTEPPPVGRAVTALPRFTASDRSFSVEYPLRSHLYTGIQKSGNALVIELANGAAVILVQGGGAGGQTAQQVVQSYLEAKFPDGRAAYEIPHAMVGYNPGYGEVVDVYPQTTTGASAHARLVVLAAVKNNTYVLVVGYGAYKRFAPGEGITHPSGTATPVALFMDPIINSVLWKGDSPR